MTEEELKKAIGIDYQLRELKRAKQEAINVLKEIELNKYASVTCPIKLEGTHCTVRTSSAAIFMRDELDYIIQEINNLEEEFSKI